MLKIYTFLKTLIFGEPSVDKIISPITKIAAKLDQHAVNKEIASVNAAKVAEKALEKQARDTAEASKSLDAAAKFRGIFGEN